MNDRDRAALDSYITRGPPEPEWGTCANCFASEEDHYQAGDILVCPSETVNAIVLAIRKGVDSIAGQHVRTWRLVDIIENTLFTETTEVFSQYEAEPEPDPDRTRDERY